MCASCHALGSWFCERCTEQLTPYQPRTGKPLLTYPRLKHTFSAVEYRDTAIPLVTSVKYQYQTAYIRVQAEIIHKQCWPQLKHLHPTLLVPVPLHPKRLRWRGFNQAHFLAQHLSKKWGIPVDDNGLHRKFYRHTQASGNLEHRKQLQHDFLCKEYSSFRNQCIVLIDDVLTTGATLSACARALECTQPRKIIALTFARTQ